MDTRLNKWLLPNIVFMMVFLELTTVKGKAQLMVSFDASVNKDIYTLVDDGNELLKPRRINVAYGIPFAYRFIQNTTLSSGLYLKVYNNVYRLKTVNIQSNSSGNAVLTIPFTLGQHIHLNQVLLCMPYAGISFNQFLLNEDGSFGSGQYSLGRDTIYVFDQVSNKKNNFIMANIGFSIDYVLSKHLSLNLYTQYQLGFGIIRIHEIKYGSNSSLNHTAKQQTKGSYYTPLGFAIRYHLKSKPK